MADTDTLGSLLQGVSQQPPHLRQDGQVTQQTNLLSHVTRGLTTRPGAILEGLHSNDLSSYTLREVTIDGEYFQIGTNPKAVPELGDEAIVLMDQTGTKQTVTYDPAVIGYIGTDMDVYVYDNKEDKSVFLFNREYITALDADVTAQQSEVIRDIALVTSLGGLFSHTYTIYAEDLTGNVVVGSYTTPDGNTTGDAAKVTSDYIANQLHLSLGSAPGRPAGMVVSNQGSVVQISGVPGIRIAVEDGSGGDTLVYQTNTAKSTVDLANFAPHGTLVRVIGLDGTEDDFWMRFEVAEEDTVGNGFGSEGLWREWYNVDEPSRLDPTTMPHVIVQTAPGVFVVEPAEWAARLRGDADTNPAPGFIGKAIRDINGFQSRLVVVAGSLTNMTVTNEPTNFFKQSAVAELATDPIEMLSTAPGEFSLQYIIPFDRDLIICGNKNQFIITGGQGLTAANASMVQTTEFEMSAGVRPAATGKTLLLPFTQGEYSGVKEFFSSNSVDANSATTLTEIVPKLLKGTITDIQTSTNFDTALVRVSDPDNLNKIFVYKYLWDGENKVQSAWSEWEFSHEVLSMYFDESQVYITLSPDPSTYYQTTINLDLPENAELGYHLVLDANTSRIVTGTAVSAFGTAYTTVTIPKSLGPQVIRQGTGCLNLGQVVNPVQVVTDAFSDVYWLDAHVVPTGATVWTGIDYTATLRPTMPFIRDGANKVMRFVRLVLTRFVLHYDASGPMTATRRSKYRKADVSVTNAKVILDNNPEDPAKVGIESGAFDVPFREQSDHSELTITAHGGLPITINEIEWVGQARGGKRRR